MHYNEHKPTNQFLHSFSACRWQNHQFILVEELVKLFSSNYQQNPQTTAAVHYFPKEPPEVFCKKMCSLKVHKYRRKIPVLESIFNKVLGLKNFSNFTGKHQHRCFLVKFEKFLRILILKNICKSAQTVLQKIVFFTKLF